MNTISSIERLQTILPEKRSMPELSPHSLPSPLVARQTAVEPPPL